MTILSKADLVAAGRSRWPLGGPSGSQSNTAFYTFLTPFGTSTAFGNPGALATPPAYGSGGTLWTKGDVGFPVFANGSTSISGVQGHAGALQNFAYFDLVWGASGVAANTTSTQTVVGFPTLVRPDVNGTGLELFIFVRTAANNTSTVPTITYTNSAGTGGRTATPMLTAALTVLNTAGNLIPFRLQPGDTGVKSVDSIAFSVAHATAGDIWLLLAKRVLHLANANTTKRTQKDFLKTLMAPVHQDAALVMFGMLAGNNFYQAGEVELAHG